MGLFSKSFSLDEMIKQSDIVLERSFDLLKPGEMNDYPKYVDGHWEIRFIIHATENLWKTISSGSVVDMPFNMSFGLANFDYLGHCIVMELLRFDGRSDLSYGMIARPHLLGEKKTPLEKLDYYEILSNQKTITCEFKYNNQFIKGCTISNPLYQNSAIQTIRSAVNKSISDVFAYQNSITGLSTSFLAQAEIDSNLSGSTPYERLGRVMWNKYEGK